MSNPMVFTADEMACAVYMAAAMDPEKFSHPTAKAFIAKAQACVKAGAIPVAEQPEPQVITRITSRRRGWEIS